MKQKTFFIIVDGKEQKYVFKKDEFKQYQTISEMTWGGLPLDVGWAKETQVYKEGLKTYSNE